MDKPTPYGLAPYLIDRIMQKRGRLHVFDHFNAAETALIVIDMQRYYLSDIPETQRIIPAINRLAAGFRERGGPVVWVTTTAGEDGKSLWPLYHESFFKPEGGARHRDGLTAGTEGHQIHPDMDVRDGDWFAGKSRFSAFLPGKSELPDMLAAAGIKNVVITGVVTNFCCETAARDAMMLDYRVAMIYDATAARYEEDHQLGIASVFVNFCDVRTADELLDSVLV